MSNFTKVRQWDAIDRRTDRHAEGKRRLLRINEHAWARTDGPLWYSTSPPPLSPYILGISQTAVRPDGCLSEWRRILQKEGRRFGWTEHRACYWIFFWGGGVTETSCICRDNSAETQFSSVQLISAEFSWVQLSSVQLSSAQFLVWTQGRPLQGFLGTLWRKWSKSASASCWWQCGWLWWWFKTAWHQNHTIIIRTTKACYWVQISNLSDIGHVSVLVTRQYWPRVSIGHVSVLITCQYCPRNAFSAL